MPEVTVTAWDGDWEPTLYTIHGEDGTIISALESTPNELVGGFYSQVFVTDAVGDGSDQAIFVTPLTSVNAGYYAERRSLADGAVLETSVIGNAAIDELYQGPDFTGDGRRDALAFQYGPSFHGVGVFDGGSMSMKWSRTFSGTDGISTYIDPYEGGDVDGDGGIDLCTVEYTSPFPPVGGTQSLAIGCYAGRTGSELWRVSREVSGDYAFTWTYYDSDLDGNSVIDPLLETGVYECQETPDDFSCEITSYEAVALSGLDGSALWTIDDPERDYFVWGLTDSNLDGTPGDDGIDWTYSDEASQDAPFAVYNGRDLTRSWQGTIDTGEIEGYVDWPIEADVDGDGAPEAVFTAEAYEGIGEETCEVYEGEEYCWYDDYIEYAYVAAFEPAGELLWQLEL